MSHLSSTFRAVNAVTITSLPPRGRSAPEHGIVPRQIELLVQRVFDILGRTIDDRLPPDIVPAILKRDIADVFLGLPWDARAFHEGLRDLLVDQGVSIEQVESHPERHLSQLATRLRIDHSVLFLYRVLSHVDAVRAMRSSVALFPENRMARTSAHYRRVIEQTLSHARESVSVTPESISHITPPDPLDEPLRVRINTELLPVLRYLREHHPVALSRIVLLCVLDFSDMQGTLRKVISRDAIEEVCALGFPIQTRESMDDYLA